MIALQQTKEAAKWQPPKTFDSTEFPDIESYIWFLQSNVIRTTGMECPLPEGDTEAQARVMFRHLDKIGGLTLLED